MSILVIALAALSAATTTPCAQEPAARRTDRTSVPSATSSPQDQLEAWRCQHGAAWRSHTSSRTGTLELLHGGSAAPSFEPDTSVEAHWFRLGREWIVATEGMHGVAQGELVDARVFFLPLAQSNSTDKMTVRFDQVIDGVPVENGRINVLFDLQGRLLSLHSTAAPVIADPSTRPAFDAAFASFIARETFTSSERVVPTHIGAAQLVFASVDDQEARRWTLAWQVDAQWVEPDHEPKGYTYTIDARTRQILKRATSIHYCDVTGTISSMATPGVVSDHPGNPPAPTPMRYIRVESSAGTVYTDANGAFTFPGVNTPLDITVRYSGTFTDVINLAGVNHAEMFNNVQPNQPNALLMNPSAAPFVTAQANGFNWVSLQRDWIRSVMPNDNTADFLSRTNVNMMQTCNSFFSVDATNHSRAGAACYNTAYSSVVAHEMGHWFNMRYGTGNSTLGMGEGNADVFSIYMLDEPLVAPFFYTSGNPIRDANNTRQYCGDYNPGCHGQSHADGEVWMGAAWKVRTRLNATLGNVLGDLHSNLLFLGWMNSYNQTDIHSIIETQWLTLDDDDGNLHNGTPNYAEIDAGFRQQGFPGVGLHFIEFTGITKLVTTTDEVGPYVIDADIVASFNPPLSAATLRYRVDGGAIQSVPMTNIGGDTYSARIPGQSAPAGIEYVVSAQDSSGNSSSYPSHDVAQGYSFAVGQSDTIYATSFEFGSGPGPFDWVPLGGLPNSGRWTHGDPEGTAAQPEDDHTSFPGVSCWFTGRSPAGAPIGQNDVDGGAGPTHVVSPAFDLASVSLPQISYWRWYSNTQGNAPGEDTLTVQLSGDGGGTWTTVETVGPTGAEADGGWYRHSFLVRSFLAPTDDMRLRITASDVGEDSIVEAAIDDVLVASIEDIGPLPANFTTLNPGVIGYYCPASVNSTGNPGTISFRGSPSVALNTAVLGAQDLPLGTVGFFFFGDQRTHFQLPGGSGFLCVNGTLLRLPPVVTDTTFGRVSFPLDFTDQNSSAHSITAGSVWNFQFWHRDVNFFGNATSNMTNAVGVHFGI
jgi:hypothetical protein